MCEIAAVLCFFCCFLARREVCLDFPPSRAELLAATFRPGDASVSSPPRVYRMSRWTNSPLSYTKYTRSEEDYLLQQALYHLSFVRPIVACSGHAVGWPLLYRLCKKSPYNGTYIACQQFFPTSLLLLVSFSQSTILIY